MAKITINPFDTVYQTSVYENNVAHQFSQWPMFSSQLFGEDLFFYKKVIKKK